MDGMWQRKVDLDEFDKTLSLQFLPAQTGADCRDRGTTRGLTWAAFPYMDFTLGR